MKPTLTIFTLAYNLEKIKYPYEASIRSACHFADEVLVAECFSTDGTYEHLLELQRELPKIRIVRHEWGTNCEIQKTLAELCCKEATSDWIFYLNADEVIHELSDFQLEALEQAGRKFGAAHYTHFLGTFDTTWPFVYERVTRLQRGNVASWSPDACSLAVSDKVAAIPVEIQHFGKVNIGRAAEAGVKEMEFQAMYKEYGFPDPTCVKMVEETGGMDYAEAVRINWKKADAIDTSRPFTGTLSAFVLPWKREMEEAERLKHA